MQTRRATRFDTAHHSVQATGRILASCKALLGRLGDELRSLQLDLDQLRRRLNDPVIAEALAAVAELEGTAAPVEPILGWPIAGMIRTWPHELLTGEYASLERAGIATFGDLVSRTSADLIVLDGFGPSGLRVLERVLDGSGLSLARASCPPPQTSPIFELAVADVLEDPSARLLESLDRAGITTVADLVARSPESLSALEGIGAGSLECIRHGLERFGLSLAATACPGIRAA